MVLYIQLSSAQNRPLSWCSTLRRRPKPGREQLLLVGDAVAVRVGVLPDFVRVRFLRRAPRWRQTASRSAGRSGGRRRRRAFRTRRRCSCPRAPRCDRRIELAGGVGVLHVAAQLDDEHPAVAVEGDLAGSWMSGSVRTGSILNPGGSQNFFCCSAGDSATIGGFFEKSGSFIAGPRPPPAPRAPRCLRGHQAPPEGPLESAAGGAPGPVA